MADRHIKIMGTSALLLAALAIGGCTATAGNVTPPTDCGAEALQGQVGQPVTGTTSSDLHVGGVPVAPQGVVRVVGPGQAMTMDYRADRLTIETDGAGNLLTARCV